MQPLSGMVVLDLSVGLMAPLAGAILGDLGAEVIKIEDARSEDPYRHSPMLAGFVPGLLANNVNAWFEGYNRNKKGIAIDLKTEAGKSILYRLVARSDVFLTSYRQAVLERLGEYADLAYVLEHRLGVLPRGYNHVQGRSRFIIVTPDQESYEPFRAELKERTGG